MTRNILVRLFGHHKTGVCGQRLWVIRYEICSTIFISVHESRIYFLVFFFFSLMGLGMLHDLVNRLIIELLISFAFICAAMAIWSRSVTLIDRHLFLRHLKLTLYIQWESLCDDWFRNYSHLLAIFFEDIFYILLFVLNLVFLLWLRALNLLLVGFFRFDLTFVQLLLGCFWLLLRSLLGGHNFLTFQFI